MILARFKLQIVLEMYLRHYFIDESPKYFNINLDLSASREMHIRNLNAFKYFRVVAKNIYDSYIFLEIFCG